MVKLDSYQMRRQRLAVEADLGGLRELVLRKRFSGEAKNSGDHPEITLKRNHRLQIRAGIIFLVRIRALGLQL